MKKLFFIIMFVIFGLSACLPVDTANGQNFVQVTKENQEQTINLSVEQILEIQLPRKESNGYVWCEANNSNDKAIQKSIAKIGDIDFIRDPFPTYLPNKKGRMAGGSGTQIIRYVGTSQGTTVLILELKRPWIKNCEVIDSYTITIVSGGKYIGTYMPQVKTIHKYEKPLTSKTSTLPSSWDWRSQCTPVKDQGICEDCWAYATVGDLECNILIHDGVTKDISEEFVTDCAMVNCLGCPSGCTGGICANFVWLRACIDANSAGGGAVWETEDPTTCNITGVAGTCEEPYASHDSIDRYADIGGQDSNGVPSVDSIKFRIFYDGPVFVAANCANWENGYIGGIWVASGATTTNHAICLVGWKDTTVVDNSGGYWILRNSWGSHWGINGYMYISYGSDLVGCDADYIVYKGGTPQEVPPLTAFTVSDTASCTSGIVQFTDKSINFPTSWSWSFGDGGTSNLQNPSHTYTTNGTYTVSLTASNSYGNGPTVSRTNYITINMPEVPNVTGGSTQSGGSVTLTAYGTGILYWYNAFTGGTLLHTGTFYTTPPLTITTTYYVQNAEVPPAQSAGMVANTAYGTYYTSTKDVGLIFNALSDIIINSVTIYADSTNTKRIMLKDSNGTILNSVTTSLNGEQTITLNFNVPSGNGYELVADSVCYLWAETSGATFPYTTAGLVSIIANIPAFPYQDRNHYFYFYNWQVIGPPCLSTMIPVNATVTMGINELSNSLFVSVYPNPASDEIEVSTTKEGLNSIEIYNLLGERIYSSLVTDNISPFTINIKNFPSGVYIVEVKTEKGVEVRKFVKE